MDTSDQAREQLYGGIAPALSLSDEAFANYLTDLDRWEGRLEQVIETQLQPGVHYKERLGFRGGPKTRVVNLAGALKLKDVLGLELEWSKKLSRGDGVKTPHLQWEVTCRVQSGSKWQPASVAIADTFESDFRYRRDFYQCPGCGEKTVFRSLTGGGWYCSRRHGGCGKEYGEFEVAIIHQVRPTVEREDPRELSDLLLQTALARAIRRSVLRSIGRGRALLVPAEDDDETEADAAALIDTHGPAGAPSPPPPPAQSVSEEPTVVPPKASAPVVPPKASVPVVPPKASAPVVPPKASVPVVPPKASAPVVPPKASAPVVPPKASAPVVPPKASAPVATVPPRPDPGPAPQAPGPGPTAAASKPADSDGTVGTDQADRLRAGFKNVAAAAQAQEVGSLTDPLGRASGVVMDRAPDPPTKAASNGHDAERLVADTLRLGEHQQAILAMLGQRRFAPPELLEWARMVQALPPGVDHLDHGVVKSMPDNVAGQLRALMEDRLQCANQQVDALLKVCRSSRVSQERMNELAGEVGVTVLLTAAVMRSLDEATAMALRAKLAAEVARA